VREIERGTPLKEKKSADAQARRQGVLAPAARLTAQLLIIFL
jgi:hypothetical protein